MSDRLPRPEAGPAIDFKGLVLDNCFVSQVSIDEITEDLPAFLRRVEVGEELTIMHAGRALAEVKPILSSPPIARPSGLCAGQFTVPDDFDEPLPEAVLQDFEGRSGSF
ncbi:MAG: type II toxin-antitoxin system Phd/YefM family antitoxin [Blastocatellia bacterium]